MYQNYIFDLYGTLIDIRTDEWADENWNAFAEWLYSATAESSGLAMETAAVGSEDKGKKAFGYGLSGSEIHAIYDREVARLAALPTPYKHPEIDILPVFETIVREEKRSLVEGSTSEISVTYDEAYRAGEQFRILTTKMIRLYPNTKKVLEGLHAAGKKVYLLSNAQHVFTWQELSRTGILEDFDDIFISSDAGVKKPDPAFYEKLFTKHGLKKEESLMVGNDSTCDIAGADAWGIDSLYVRTAISPEHDPTPDCKYVFEDGDIGHVLETL